MTLVPHERSSVPQRSQRYRVGLSLRYRFPTEDCWYRGLTADISDTGLAFDTDRSVWDFESAPSEGGVVPIELMVEVPSDASPAQNVMIGGRGSIGHTVRSLESRQTHVAVVIEHPHRGRHGAASARPHDALGSACRPLDPESHKPRSVPRLR